MQQVKEKENIYYEKIYKEHVKLAKNDVRRSIDKRNNYVNNYSPMLFIRDIRDKHNVCLSSNRPKC